MWVIQWDQRAFSHPSCLRHFCLAFMAKHRMIQGRDEGQRECNCKARQRAFLCQFCNMIKCFSVPFKPNQDYPCQKTLFVEIIDNLISADNRGITGTSTFFSNTLFIVVHQLLLLFPIELSVLVPYFLPVLTCVMKQKDQLPTSQPARQPFTSTYIITARSGQQQCGLAFPGVLYCGCSFTQPLRV